MPITNASQVKRTVQMSGTIVPERFLAMVDRFGGNPDAMKQAGVIYATEQIIDLDQLEKLEQLFVEQVNAFDENYDLLDVESFSIVFYLWKCFDEDRVKEYVNKVFSNLNTSSSIVLSILSLSNSPI